MTQQMREDRPKRAGSACRWFQWWRVLWGGKFAAKKTSKMKPALNTRTSVSGSKDEMTYHYNKVVHALHPVRYVQRFVEIDFFRSLGRLNRPALKHWYCDTQKGTSPVSAEIFAENEAWRKQYWDNSLNAMTAKTSDWSHECEYRLVLQSSLFDLSDRDSRKLKYDFSDLQGIIFGAKTLASEKLEIMKIVEEKCREADRQEFEFFQAEYSAESGVLIAAPMSLLKFKF